MSDSPDQIRADIERTRQDLGGDVDALADKVTPSKIVDRQKDRAREAVRSVRERIMGAADDAGSAVSGAGSSAAGSIGDAKDRVVAKAEGNPLAVGLIAFGAGLLAASLIPASSQEKRMAADVKDKAQPLVDEASHVARDVGEHLKEPAQQAASAVKDAAADSVETVKTEAQSAATDVKDQAQHSRENIAGG
ncbi:DUF3618 domain-containing protein [Microbacterium sp. zg.Y1090]|uniref:DUF3618 domain-containing protein n=1 Tax=Microbacterium TaxID=33882 RepID=UPI00214C482E|nr:MULTISPECIES: DUF3618 domain-containing protein [unclassified Microbacterium]MCR2812124.1 DUF3618 domain-containing protein [Microbacterium sp. zg.Y1084]MCR2818438.1 DUF3618 domain-containing protein [Microbacterium sp. zg.Y1090]MDL5486251.1 DUF3618 domain-containing protein [Microbacterium sp. zg-Y1211]WIM29449.1 DUF3618 domain-containing protein [Microbacterium sp. zg-Y1090]